MRSFPKVLNPRSVGVAIAIIVAMAYSPDRAEAACGDYVHIATDKPVELLPPSFPVLIEVDSPRQPCHGPNCSRKPSRPVPPLSAPVTESSPDKELAVPGSIDIDLDLGMERCFGSELSVCPISQPNSVFHPPRS